MNISLVHLSGFLYWNAVSFIHLLIIIFWQAHPTITDLERKKVCSLMDCQKLSREACAHAAQNDRLPVQTVVQVLYYEQQRLRDVMNGSISGGDSPAISSRVSLYPTDYIHPVSDEVSSLKRENEDLKLELVKMKMRLKEIERPSSVRSASPSASAVNSPMGTILPSSDKPPLPRKSFINSVSKKLGRLYPFVRADGVSPSGAKGRTRPSKDRRHSISWHIGFASIISSFIFWRVFFFLIVCVLLLRLEKTCSCRLSSTIFFSLVFLGYHYHDSWTPFCICFFLCGVAVNNIIFMFDKHIVQRKVVNSKTKEVQSIMKFFFLAN